jgi:hypothetical protein
VINQNVAPCGANSKIIAVRERLAVVGTFKDHINPYIMIMRNEDGNVPCSFEFLR